MAEFFQEGHPCRGKDCKDCETCIFDEDLFLDKVQPNKKNNNMCSRRLCNECVNLTKSYEMRSAGRFDAACKIVTYEALGEKRPRRIDFNLSVGQTIVAPQWCPLLASNPIGLPSPSQVSTPSETTTPKPTRELTYSERRERMKELPKHLEWEDIEEGKVYVIPKIMSQARKIVKVIAKTELCCSCHEISEITGNEYQYNCSVYPSDLDAVFITELRNF